MRIDNVEARMGPFIDGNPERRSRRKFPKRQFTVD
jgi:hypothetical protein